MQAKLFNSLVIVIKSVLFFHKHNIILFFFKSSYKRVLFENRPALYFCNYYILGN